MVNYVDLPKMYYWILRPVFNVLSVRPILSAMRHVIELEEVSLELERELGINELLIIIISTNKRK